MSVKLIQNFEYLENFSLNGNAAISTVHKFGHKSVAFSGAGDFVSVSNNSGLFNIFSHAVRNFECFFYPTVDLTTINWNDNGVFLFNEHAFKLFNIEKSWLDAKSFCENIGGHLAVIPNQETNNFILQQFIHDIDFDVWGGGFKQNGSWIWLNGDVIEFFNWMDGAPLDNEDFLEFHSNGEWDSEDNKGYNNKGFICEWDNLSDAYFALNGYSFFNGHSFKFFSDKKYWLDSKAYCEYLGGHLATSTSQDKNIFLTSCSNGNGSWLNGLCINGSWSWLNGETWDYTYWGNGKPTSSDENRPTFLQSDGFWDNNNKDNLESFICEWDYDFRSLGFIPGYIFNFDNGLSLMLNHDAALRLLSEQANIDVASTAAVTPDSWHHLSLCFYNNSALVYLDGQLVISALCQNINIAPNSFSLGGFSGYIDEFAVRDDYDAQASIPARHFETLRRKSSAPVKFAVWSCNNLPDGLTLSESGLLEGTPTVTGTFNCNISLNTNWGTANKSTRIVII